MADERTGHFLSQRWAEVDGILRRCLALPSGDRVRFLEETCGGDRELLEFTRRLLEQEALADRRFGEPSLPLDELAPPPLDPGEDPMVGRSLGPYRIVSRIGRGGGGSVYVAERADGTFQRRVAIKVLHGVVPSDEAIARFRAERQILAQLDHPSICRLFGGGELADGQPYLVMELVEGEPITDFCDRRRLGIRERIELLLQVCDAVQYAHRNLFVHRDLKPGNILVTPEGRVKLLDFGIAKILDPDPEVAPAHFTTRLGGSPMTPAYASPEQVSGRPVTTATDVYALGVLLYRLLTGRLPFEVRDRSPAELERLISERTPLPPSSAAAKSEGTSKGGPHLPTPPYEGWARRLKGDLDTIILKALRKEPERRYASPLALGEDLRRHLEGRPVEARPSGLLYRTGKLARRRPGAVAALGAGLLVVAGYGATLVAHAERLEAERDLARAEAIRAEEERTRAEVEAFRALEARQASEAAQTEAELARLQAEEARDRLEVEAARAEQVTAFLVELFESADPVRAEPGEVTIRDLLQQGVRRVDELAHQPSVQAELALTMARVHHALGLFPEALELSERALAAWNQVSPGSLQAAEARLMRGRVLHRMGEFGEAEEIFRQVLQIRRDSLGGSHPQVANALQDLGAVVRSQGRLDEAGPLYQTALGIRREGLGDGHPSVAESLNSIGLLRRDMEDYEGAETALREALAIQRGFLGDGSPVVARYLSNLALVLRSTGRYPEAEELYREALEIMREVYGREHPDVATVLNNLGLLLRYQGRYGPAEEMTREALEIRRSLFGDEHPEVAQAVNNLGLVLRAAGDLDGAEEMYRESLRTRRLVYGQEHPAVATALNNLAFLLGVRGDHSASEALYREALEMRVLLFGDEHPAVARSLMNLGVSLREQGMGEEAETTMLRSLEIQRRELGNEHPGVASGLENLALLYRDQARYDEAEELLEEALALRIRILGADHPDVASTRAHLDGIVARRDR
jgi:eukaryotic-like serine/threonine-protein kinase